MATVGSALVCSVRLAFSSGVSTSEIFCPEPLDRRDLSDLGLPKLSPRPRFVDSPAWEGAIFMAAAAGLAA